MTEFPEYKDQWDSPKDAWHGGIAACKPIISELEGQLAAIVAACQNAELCITELREGQQKLASLLAQKVLKWTIEKIGLEKQLAEARAEIAGAYVAAANIVHGWKSTDYVDNRILEEQIIALTPESARQALEQRIAEAVADESEEWYGHHLHDPEWASDRIRTNRAKADGATK